MQEKTANATKMLRQPENAIRTAPRLGARAGTSEKINITKDMIFAMARPEYRSRTNAIVATRGADAASPINSRDASMVSRLGAR